MKKIILFFVSLVTISTIGFSETLVLENQTSYPLKNEKSKIAIQWATSAKEVDEGNKSLIYKENLKSNSIQVLTQRGKIDLSVPEKAQYFRIIVWSNGEGEPDLLTNWVDIVPNKTYTVKTDHLVPTVLMSGTGC